MNVMFESPWAFLLLLAVPPLVYLEIRRGYGAFTYSSNRLFGSAKSPLRARLLWLPSALRILALIALVIAVARPQAGLNPVRNVTEGVAIAMVVDRSGSMNRSIEFRGESQTKLEVVKSVFGEFLLGNDAELGGRPNDLVGIVAFAGHADTISPLTHSHDALVDLLDTLDIVRGYGGGGTAIGDAIALAAARLRTAEQELSEEDRASGNFTIESKIMILLTDGEHNAGERTPSQGVSLAEKWGIRIHTIGFGGGQDGAALLEGIANTTGGLHQRAEDVDGLRAVYEEIDRLEKTEIEAVEYLSFREYFLPFAIAAAMLLALELLLRYTWLRRVP
jgi:Ca-activated chloride channel family protein